MAKVFTDKVIIPGDQIDNYLEAMAEAEATRQPFRISLENLNYKFADYLDKKYVKKTVRKHTNIVDMFIKFIYRQTDVETIEEITRGMVNSYFRGWYKKKVWDSATDNDLRVALRKFFQFLATEEGIVNQKALDSLK
ncbi:MAG: site-specific integrase [Trichodesmium sp. MAG_R04]|nr:site-specific integrase [Trichodesmium sp. MAG_R04]